MSSDYILEVIDRTLDGVEKFHGRPARIFCVMMICAGVLILNALLVCAVFDLVLKLSAGWTTLLASAAVFVCTLFLALMTSGWLARGRS